MLLKRTYAVLVIALLIAFSFGMFSTEATAQGNKEQMSKKGMAGLFSGKLGNDDPRSPSAAQKWLGLGSLGVMVIVIKYL